MCDLDGRIADKNPADYAPARYAIPGDGHPSSYSNRLVAQQIKECAFDSASQGNLLVRNVLWEPIVPVKKVQYETQQIRSNPNAMRKLQAEADENQVSLDSLIQAKALRTVIGH